MPPFFAAFSLPHSESLVGIFGESGADQLYKEDRGEGRPAERWVGRLEWQALGGWIASGADERRASAFRGGRE